jgi:hypothetical protein
MNFNFIFNSRGVMRARHTTAVFILILAGALAASAQENYFVTYTHQMEEPGNLEVGLKSASGWPKAGNSFVGSSLEFEYGMKTWWTTELYLDGQATAGANATFSGFRWENRFRPLLTEHWINPVLYAEFEDINGSNRSLLEIVGHDGLADTIERPERAEKERELELKLILSSNTRGWNFAENFIAEKNFAAGEPWEFGYAVGASRALSLKASPNPCTFCRENFALGAEMYGGLGDTDGFGLSNTSHYLAPTVTWNVPAGPTFRISPGFGLNGNSNGFLLRLGMTYEFEQIFARKDK